MFLEDLTYLEDVLELQLAGGVSSVLNTEGGFIIGWFKDKEIAAICLAINRKGEVFARFMKDGTVDHEKNLSRGEVEAIDGIKKLHLGWKL